MNTPITPATLVPTLPVTEKQFPFFELPAEIRNEVYILVFCLNTPHDTITLVRRQADHESNQLDISSLMPLKEPGYSPRNLSALLTCRRFHDEAIGIIYYIPTITSNSPEPILVFLRLIRPSFARSLNKIHLICRSETHGDQVIEVLDELRENGGMLGYLTVTCAIQRHPNQIDSTTLSHYIALLLRDVEDLNTVFLILDGFQKGDLDLIATCKIGWRAN
jgi:hypothetical protein